MQLYSADQFRKKLAGLESPECRFSDLELEDLKETGVELVGALRSVFGKLDPKTCWERISNGLTIAAAKSRGKGDEFIAELLDYVKAEPNVVVGNDKLRQINAKILMFPPEKQRMFIRTCVRFRMLMCLEARDLVQEYKNLLAQTGAEKAIIDPDGTIRTWGETN